MFHRDFVDLDNHALPAVTYADIAARDADATFNTAATNVNKSVRVDSPLSFFILGSIAPVWIELGTSVIPTFIVLPDTPSSYAGQAGFVAQVNAAEDAIEFGQALRATDSPTFAQVTLGNTGLVVGTSIPFSDAAGVLTLQNIDALDATAEATIEAAIDALVNLTTAGSVGNTISLLGNLSVAGTFTTVDDAITDPAVDAAVTTAKVDAFAGTVVTLTAASNSQTIAAPTDTTAGRRFVVVNDDVSSDPLLVNTMNIGAGNYMEFRWDGSAWVTSASGSAALPGGASGAVQFNSAGVFGGGAALLDVAGALSGLTAIDLATADLAYETGGNAILFADTTAFNTLVGVGAGGGPATPLFRSVAVGYQALLNAGSGNEHTAVGYQALLSNDDGFFNTAVGFQALMSNLSGLSNTAIGHLALTSNETGGRNVAIGQDSLRNNVSGEDNVAIGEAALLNNVSGDNNLAMGFQALRENLSFFNLALGAEAMRDHVTGNSSTAIGRRAGRFIADGSTPNTQSIECLFLGAESRSSNDTVITNEIVIGFQAIGRGSNTVVLGNDSIASTALKGAVGAGTLPTTARLTVGAAVPADGDQLLLFNTERSWAFEQEDTGSATSLRLRNVGGPNKSFLIDTDGNMQWRSRDGSTIFMVLTQSNEGRLGIGPLSATFSAALDVQSTIRGALPTPRMTTVQKEAIVSPATALMVFDTNRGRYEFFDGAKYKGLEEAALNIVYFTDESDLPAPVSGQIPLAENTTYVMYNDDPSVSQKQVTIANEFLFPDAGGCRITSIGLATALLVYTGTGTFFNTTSSFTGFIHIDELFLACPSGTLFNIDGVLPVGSEFFPRIFMSNMGVFDTDTLGTIKTISINFNVGAFFDCGQGLILDHLDEALIGDWRFANWKNEAGSVFVTARNQLRFPQLASCTIETGSNETAFNIEPSIGDETFLITGNTYRGGGAAYATGASGTITAVTNVNASGTVTAVAGTAFGESIFTDAAHGLVQGQFLAQTGFSETQYNGTFEVLEIIDVDNYRLHVAFTATDTGSWTSDRIQFAAVNSLSVGDGVQVTDSSVPSYDANYRVLGVSGAAFFVNGTFVATATGNFNTDSLDQTDEPMLVVGNAGLPNSAATFFGALNGNTNTTTITDGTYAAIDVTGMVAVFDQRFVLTDAAIGLWTYLGKAMAAGVLVSNLSLTKTGAVAEYRFALSINGAIPVFATAFHFNAAISPTRSQISMGLPTGTLNTGDTLQIMAAGDGTSDAITVADGNEFVAIIES